MAYTPKDMTASLFKNERKRDENDADYQGSGMLNGVECWVNGYAKKSASGKAYIYMTFKPKQGQAPRPSYDKKSKDVDW